MLKYFKKTFEKPENGLMQTIVTHALVFIGLLLVKIINKLTGFLDFEKICTYLCLSNETFYTKPWTLLTYFFVYGPASLWELLVNLLVLHTFGRIVVHFLGSRKFLILYLVGGIAGGVTFLLSYHFLPYFIKLKSQALTGGESINQLAGGSAALYAVIAGIATFAPNFGLGFFPFFSIKIKYIAIAFLAWPLLNLSYGGGEEGMHMARIGGAVWGYVYMQYLLLYNDKKWRIWFKQLYDSLKKLPSIFTKNIRKNVDRTTTKPSKAHQKACKEEIDAILDKIALHGYQKLTQEEKRKLFEAGTDT